ncbi:MAG: YbaB/EbfC family nucleoid-associated protein [Candidatus Pacebacteria bacterium]|nr:YbaB/EbfC family nucleoid-associated protein [Candidatus Paceibacterota bacterium]
MKNLNQMMKQAQEVQSKMAEMQNRLDSSELEGSAGGGMVKVTLTGKGDLRRIAIEPSLLKPDDADMLEDLIIAAHNDARAKIESFMQDEMGKITGGLKLPPGMKLPF